MDPGGDVFTVRERFDDFDAFTEAARDWQLRFHQLDRGRFVGEMEQVVAGPVAVGRCRFNRRLQQLGSPPPGCRTFGVTQPDHTSFDWRRQEVGAGDLLGFRTDAEMDCISAPGFHLFAVSIAEDLLAAAARRLGFESHEEVLGPELVTKCPEGTLRELRKLCGAATGITPANPAVGRALARDLSSELPGLILEGFLSGERKRPVPPPLARRRALRLAMEAIVEEEEPICTVAELCRLTGEGERTLRYAFCEFFGVSPKSYLQARRLNAVRRMLLAGGPDTVIADAANREGFWHMGQFAADYRRMFGELPSATLMRGRAI